MDTKRGCLTANSVVLRTNDVASPTMLHFVQTDLILRRFYAILPTSGDGMSKTNNWRFCVVGNITAQHTDADGKILYGSKAFSGGTKVYIDDLTYSLNHGRISVIGQNRFGRYVVESVPKDLIENVRAQRVFKPVVLQIMEHLEVVDGWIWRGRTTKDKKEVNAFVDMWKTHESD